MARDPVYGMTVDDKSLHRSTHAGQTYVFCCSTCKAKFDKEPGRYATSVGREVKRGDRP